jgi:hypothetical protein
MRGARLKNWIDGANNCENYAQMINKYGVYNDIGFYCNINSENREKLMKLINNSELVELYGVEYQRKQPYWKKEEPDKKLEDMIKVGLNSYKEDGEIFKNQLNVTFPNEKIIFYEGSRFSDVGDELDYEYTSRFQFMLFGDCKNVRPQLSLFVNEFILLNKIPTYVISGNCKRDKYKKFSVFINE